MEIIFHTGDQTAIEKPLTFLTDENSCCEWYSLGVGNPIDVFKNETIFVIDMDLK